MSRLEMFSWGREAPTVELSRCTDLVPLPRDVCGSCGGPTVPTAMSQPALFRHGGYGETRRTVAALCLDPDCLRVRTVAVESVRPDRRLSE